MKDDPVIKAVRDARHQISESVDHDPQKLVEYYRQRQEKHPDRVVSRQANELHPQDENLDNIQSVEFMVLSQLRLAAELVACSAA